MTRSITSSLFLQSLEQAYGCKLCIGPCTTRGEVTYLHFMSFWDWISLVPICCMYCGNFLFDVAWMVKTYFLHNKHNSFLSDISLKQERKLIIWTLEVQQLIKLKKKVDQVCQLLSIFVLGCAVLWGRTNDELLFEV